MSCKKLKFIQTVVFSHVAERPEAEPPAVSVLMHVTNKQVRNWQSSLNLSHK